MQNKNKLLESIFVNLYYKKVKSTIELIGF